MNIKDKVMILWLDEESYFSKQATLQGIVGYQDYNELNIIGRTLRKLLSYTSISFPNSWFNKKWMKDIHRFDTIIVHDSPYSPAVIKMVQKIKPEVRIIVWYWNSVKYSVPVKKFKKLDCEIWSFDERDCIDYGLHFNTQYNFANHVRNGLEVETDVLFIGLDKNRISNLLEISSMLKRKNLSYDFHIVKSKKSDMKYRHLFKEKLSYEEVLQKISKSRAVLDITLPHQTGLTLRPLEALFLEKKLITNNKKILEKDFYESDNIFILGHDDINKLENFINSPYKRIDSTIKNYYSFEQWLRRFF